jgi:hypothetical protein
MQIEKRERYSNWKVAYIVTIKSKILSNGIVSGTITYSDEQEKGQNANR